MDKYEVFHPDADGPAPTFSTWEQALSKQVEWNKEVSGHVARKREIPIDITCPSCGNKYVGWKHEKGSECFDCFATKV